MRFNHFQPAEGRKWGGIFEREEVLDEREGRD